MGRIRVDIDEIAARITVESIVTAAGHVVAESEYGLRVTDSLKTAEAFAGEGPVIVLVTAAGIPEAAAAMGRGVYDYALLPLQPGELVTRIGRALGGAAVAPAAVGTLEEIEARHIEDTLRRCRQNQAQAARELGIGRNTLWRKLRKIRPSDDGSLTRQS